MFKYGHMLDEHDTFVYTLPDGTKEPVAIKDKWISRQTRDAIWIELWSYGDNVIARPVAVMRIGAFDLIYGVGREFSTGTSRKTYAPQLH